jgi:putative NADPH-quinone reductase
VASRAKEAMNVTIIQGHPDSRARHFCHALADAYAAGARAGGHSVRVIDLGSIEFPLLRTKEAFDHGALPNELGAAQGDIAWAQHLLLIYPLWLGEMPAVVKAFFEQVLRPGFAFEITAHGWTAKLHGRTARVVVTMGMPAAAYRWYFGAHSLKSLRRNVLSFVGIKPVRATLIGSVESTKAKTRDRWLAKLRALGASAK